MSFLPLRCTQEQLEEQGWGEDEEMSVYGLSSSMTVPFESGVRVATALEGRNRRMKVLLAAMKVVEESVQECELNGFVVNTREIVS